MSKVILDVCIWYLLLFKFRQSNEFYLSSYKEIFYKNAIIMLFQKYILQYITKRRRHFQFDLFDVSMYLMRHDIVLMILKYNSVCSLDVILSATRSSYSISMTPIRSLNGLVSILGS